MGRGDRPTGILNTFPEWLAMMAHTMNEAARLGMGDMLGNGQFSGARAEEADATVTVGPMNAPWGLTSGRRDAACVHGVWPDGDARSTPKVRMGRLAAMRPEGSVLFGLFCFSTPRERRRWGGLANLTRMIEAHLAHFSRGWTT